MGSKRGQRWPSFPTPSKEKVSVMKITQTYSTTNGNSQVIDLQLQVTFSQVVSITVRINRIWVAQEIVIVISSPFHVVRKQSAANIKHAEGHVKESPLTMQSFCRKGWHKGHCRLQQNDNVVLASSPAQFTRKQNKNTKPPWN